MDELDVKIDTKEIIVTHKETQRIFVAKLTDVSVSTSTMDLINKKILAGNFSVDYDFDNYKLTIKATLGSKRPRVYSLLCKERIETVNLENDNIVIEDLKKEVKYLRYLVRELMVEKEEREERIFMY